ncbi:MAG TPA: hypothetical protein PLQ00_10285 [Thermoguttaceae bacterium]|nr:hypothetical protein [Thermoguttaceae bacterium]
MFSRFMTNRLAVGKSVAGLAVQAAVLAMVWFLLVLGGCSGWNLRGEGFSENELSEFCRQYRKTDPGTGPAAVSTKAQQIEESLGVHR